MTCLFVLFSGQPLSGGAKGNEPLVFQDGGKTYRAFLEGRVNGNKNPAIKLTGWTTVLCLAKPMVLENNSMLAQPFFLEKTDTSYFGRVEHDILIRGNFHLKTKSGTT